MIELSHVCRDIDPHVVQEIFSSLTNHMKSDAVYAQLLAKSKLMELFSYFIMNTNVDDIIFRNLASVEKLTKILTYIDAHIERNITIHELAEIAYMHPNYFIRLFKQQIGVPPIQYITRKKITKAKELLRSTQRSVGEIAYDLGFSDLYYFSKQFKKMLD